MSTSGRVGSDVAHPLIPYLDDRIAIVGRSGYGKSNAAKGAVEQLLADTGARVCVIDPTDAWYGLRLQRDGKTPAHPVVIFGGDRGDLPLTATSGETIGLAVAQSSQSCIVSLADFPGENARRRFAVDFLSALYEHNREPLHIVVDEADTLAPQRTVSPLDNEVLARMQQIVRRGRIRGFVPWLITQRPAVISKDVLSQADVLVAFNLTSSQDRDALGAWIEGQADKAGERAIRNELPKLARGRAVVWAPGHDSLETLEFPLSSTFDSGRTPKRGEKRQTAELQAIDVGALKARIAVVEAEINATDPKALKAEIARLEKLLEDGSRVRGATPEQLDAAEHKGYMVGYQLGGEQALSKLGPRLRNFVDQAVTWALRPEEGESPLPPAPAPTISPRLALPAPPRQGGEAKGGPELRILRVLAQRHPAKLSRTQWATLAGMKRNSGTWSTYMSRLRTAGLIAEDGGLCSCTAAGITAAGAVEQQPQSAAEVRAMWLQALGPESKMLEALLALWPSWTDRANLADRLRMVASSGTFSTYLSRLRSNGLLEENGRKVRAAPLLMESPT